MSMKQREYHLICRVSGQSHGGFETLDGARQYARDELLEAWDIFHGNLLVERHEPVGGPKGSPVFTRSLPHSAAAGSGVVSHGTLRPLCSFWSG
jgi:hypothetical protein